MKRWIERLAELKQHRRVIAVVMSAVMLLSSFAFAPTPTLSANSNKPYITMDGKEVSSVVLEENGKIDLKAESSFEGTVKYRWQIRDWSEEERWIKIAGASAKEIAVSYALIGSMLDENACAQLRCKVIYNNKEYYTEPVKVQVSYHVYENVSNNNFIPTMICERPIMYATNALADEEHTTHTIIINYLFENGAMAFEPYGATVAHGSDFKTNVTSPTVVGYAPVFVTDGSDASVVALNYTNIQENIVINVVYTPAIVNYSVHHHYQNILDDDYSVQYDRIMMGEGLTGSIVREGLELTEDELPGFRALAYERLPIAADGSTVVEIRYDRNYYLIDFNMSGGYGTEPVYTRYGATVGANNPTRPGYIFQGWELISYDGETPTDAQKFKYTISDTQTIIVPDANLTYRAKWSTKETTYTMVFWKENADDNGYTYWGCIEDIPTMSGTYVSGENRIGEIEDIEDEAHFTYNAEKTDKNVIVEGDGSTIVNVYYTRNFHKLTFKKDNANCTIPTNHTHTEECYDNICGQDIHQHTDACKKELICGQDEHTEHDADCKICDLEEHKEHTSACQKDCGYTTEHKEHTDDCLVCGKQIHPAHDASCYDGAGDKVSSLVQGAINGKKEEGYVHRGILSSYIYINGSWYEYSGSVSSGSKAQVTCTGIHTAHTDTCYKDEVHTHTDECYKDALHTHESTCYKDTLHKHDESCYRYLCVVKEHTHIDACKRLKCGIPENHAHTNSCKGTIKVVYRKYDQSLKDIWPVVDDNGVSYDGYLWTSSITGDYYTFLEKMPSQDATLTVRSKGSYEYNWYYYLETYPGQDTTGLTTKTDGGKTYYLYYTSKVYGTSGLGLTYKEDYFPITGFTQRDSKVPSFSDRKAWLYYTRNSHVVSFSNHGEILDDKNVTALYGTSISGANFTPDYPDDLEPNAYQFDGWYTTPQCFPGTEVDWETLTMPDNDLMLYAKWVPITHKIKIFKDATMTTQIGEEQIVGHRAFANAPDEKVENGNYIFQGWFYVDKSTGKEKAFVFNGIPIIQELNIYAKWSSHVTVDYVINYVDYETKQVIADPLRGSAIAGNNKTFEAKTETELYEGYQTGYYPLTNSHTITMSVDGNHEYTFEYVQMPEMPYKVQYVKAATGEVMDYKIIRDNKNSVVTETFVRYDGMMPDAYQKRLILSADATDADNDGVYDANVITFYYSTNEEDAYYRTVHYIESVDGGTYLEYRAEEKVGKIDESYSVEALTLTGFEFNGSLTKINNIVTPTTSTTITATLPSTGALIELYYDRIEVDYTVRYVDSRTGDEIVTTKTGTGVYGAQVMEYAVDLESLGYDLISENAKTLTLSADETYNALEFVYQEKVVSLKYQIVGPNGCGVLSQDAENLTAISGKANGSKPIVSEGYEFVGWYTDEDCKHPVNSALVDNATKHFTPEKADDEIWEATTYFAKFIAKETDLTIKVKNTGKLDVKQAYIFRIVGKEGTKTEDIDLTVMVSGDGQTTVTKLPIGDYTIKEMTDWSWRYENENAEQELKLEYNEDGTILTYENVREHVKWLDGNDIKINKYQ